MSDTPARKRKSADADGAEAVVIVVSHESVVAVGS